jgi:hypothetical protein
LCVANNAVDDRIMVSQLEAEEKMRLGVEEYKQKLATELDTVSRQLASERKKQQALEVYRDKVVRPTTIIFVVSFIYVIYVVYYIYIYVFII